MSNRRETFTVELSARQARIVRKYAANLRATPGDFITAMALANVATSTDKGPNLLDACNAAFFEFVARRKCPEDRSGHLVSITYSSPLED